MFFLLHAFPVYQVIVYSDGVTLYNQMLFGSEQAIKEEISAMAADAPFQIESLILTLN